MRRTSTQHEKWRDAIVALVLIVILPCLSAFTPVGSFLHVSDFSINLYGKYLCYAILAISVDLLWGYTGLLSLGQALFFTLGGYMMGMYLMRMIGALGQYHQPIPDFLVFLGWSKLPMFWRPFSSFPFAVMAAFLLPGLLATIFGYLAFRSRIRGVYFSILTQALTYAACLLFFRNSLLLGGNNGFTDFKFILGYDLRAPGTQRVLYIVTALSLALVYLFCRWLSQTKFGLVQQAIRDSENRVLFSGYAAGNYKLFVFVVASAIAALGGILYVPQVGIINPSEMAPEKSLEAVVWVAVGGRGTLFGPIVGAIFVNALKSWTTRAYPDMWLLILGLLFIFVTVFMPKGMIGLPGQLRDLKRRFRRAQPMPVEVDQPRETAEKEMSGPRKDFILMLEDVNKTFSGFKAISNLNLYMDEGELRVIIGPNGAGKSTMLDLITGRTQPDTGKIEFGRNTDLTRLNEYQINRLGIGRKFQTPSVYIYHTVFENVLLSLRGSRAVFPALFHRTTSEQKERIDQVLKTVGLAERVSAKAGSLSHGQKQWLEIGMLIAQEPKLLLVDEPAAGMSDEETHKTGELLLSLEGKHSIVVIEHDMTFVRQIARKVTVLHQGTVLCEGTVDQVQNDPRVIEVYLGHSKKREH